MQRIMQLVEEIRGLRNEAHHRSALRIAQLLEHNRKLFLDKMDRDDLDHLGRMFNAVADTPSREFGTAGYRENFMRAYELLMFHLEKII